MKGGLQTNTTPRNSAAPDSALGMVILSRSTRAEREMVTTGHAKMMHSASGTAIRVKLVMEQQSMRPAAAPDHRGHIIHYVSLWVPCSRMNIFCLRGPGRRLSLL